MKGVIFNAFEEFVVTRYGAEIYADLRYVTALDTVGPFVGSETYPADDLLALVGTAIGEFGITLDEALRMVGRRAFPAFASSLAPVIAERGDPESLLLDLKCVIPREGRTPHDETTAPRFRVEPIWTGAIVIHYESPLRLFALVEGLLDGVADWYEIPIVRELIAAEDTRATFRVWFPEFASAGRGRSSHEVALVP